MAFDIRNIQRMCERVRLLTEKLRNVITLKKFLHQNYFLQRMIVFALMLENNIDIYVHFF
jgi:hypothetical protein